MYGCSSFPSHQCHSTHRIAAFPAHRSSSRAPRRMRLIALRRIHRFRTDRNGRPAGRPTGRPAGRQRVARNAARRILDESSGGLDSTRLGAFNRATRATNAHCIRVSGRRKLAVSQRLFPTDCCSRFRLRTL